ncbi:hypothetical protein [Actinoplanes couchii]|uniref:Uncharacterized protein n=1 Tax=Actinoplanes couchii TaxID=403638 RepID=A0ABQ3X1C8_9ACTN|nr:hypothetical protein [Actinoplanes couchii]MDR6316717.1 hypothetical protein [Actinoplanes couchii]GID52326.1 hypothetical protein Aco03nite_007300 [Actinoplanes couchii]
MTLLDEAAADPRSPAWDVVWNDTCDQGYANAGSERLLPWLARVCAGFTPADRERPLVLAGFVALDAPDRPGFADEITALRLLTRENLEAGASDARMYVYLQQALLGLDGDETWGRSLDLLSDGEADVACPHCDGEHLISLDPADSPVVPALTVPLAARLHREALAAGFSEVAASVPLLFGRVDCPSCGAVFDVAGALTR